MTAPTWRAIRGSPNRATSSRSQRGYRRRASAPTCSKFTEFPSQRQPTASRAWAVSPKNSASVSFPSLTLYSQTERPPSSLPDFVLPVPSTITTTVSPSSASRKAVGFGSTDSKLDRNFWIISLNPSGPLYVPPQGSVSGSLISALSSVVETTPSRSPLAKSLQRSLTASAFSPI